MGAKSDRGVGAAGNYSWNRRDGNGGTSRTLWDGYISDLRFQISREISACLSLFKFVFAWAHGKWQMADGTWQMAHGKWQMADGTWQMAEDRWQNMIARRRNPRKRFGFST